jgi:hypothetical protein
VSKESLRQEFAITRAGMIRIFSWHFLITILLVAKQHQPFCSFIGWAFSYFINLKTARDMVLPSYRRLIRSDKVIQ